LLELLAKSKDASFKECTVDHQHSGGIGMGVIEIVESYTDEELAEVTRLLQEAGINVNAGRAGGKPPKA
jgi:hypothetical protein